MKGILTLVLACISCLLWAQDFDSQLNKANSKFFDEKYQEAKTDYENLLNQNIGDTIQRSWAYGYVGVCEQELGNIEAAKSNYVKALNMGTPGPSFYSKLLAIYKSEKDYKGQEFVLLSKRNNLPHEYKKASKSLAYLYVNSKQFEKLLPVCDELLSWYPNNSKYWYFKAIANQKLKHNDKAEEAYRKVLAIKPDDVKSNMNLGLMIFFKANKYYEKSVKQYEAIAKPTDEDYDKCKVKLEKTRKQFRQAEPMIQTAYKAKPNDNLKKALHTLYIKVKEYKKAEQYK